jgi:hypothetical protein
VKIDVMNLIEELQTTSGLVDDVPKFASSGARECDADSLIALQRALVLLSRDASVAAATLYSAIRVVQQEAELKRLGK